VVTRSIFDQNVLGDEAVWLVFFYNASFTTQYRKTWGSVYEKLERINCGTVDVDTHDGKLLARKLLADGEGIPQVPALQLFAFTDSPDSISIFDGTTPLDLKQTLKRLKRRLQPFSKNAEGNFVKQPLYAKGGPMHCNLPTPRT
jgi:hypothetical protein